MAPNMKLLLQITYNTRWGERLVVVSPGNRRLPMEYCGEGRWRGCIARYLPGREYSYEVVRDGKCVRREWKGHRVVLPENCTAASADVSDRWNDTPSDAPLYSSAFSQGIFARGRHTAASRPVGDENLFVCTAFADVHPDETLAIAGDIPELGAWTKPVPLDDAAFPYWRLALRIDGPFLYKYLIVDRKTLAPLRWEEGENRVFACAATPARARVLASDVPNFQGRRWRGAGTAVPVFSLRSEDDFGTGEFADLKKMVDWAVATGQHVIQLLPINDTTMTGTWTDSYPYNANSSFALHPQFMNLPAAGVPADGEYLRLRQELNALPQVDYERVNREKLRLLRKTFENGGAEILSKKPFREFLCLNERWLLPYALFCTLRDEYATADFTRWGKYAKYDRKVLEEYRGKHRREVDFHCFVQYHLHLQLSDACAYAHSRGVILKGDLPIGVSPTSADAWLAPRLFNMDSQAGAPPDAFSAFGQNWGFPTYDWKRMAGDSFGWWKSRLAKMSEYFDAFRIDHILGFFRIWEIPVDSVRGLLGHFSPALPYSSEELKSRGFDLSGGRFVTPCVSERMLDEIFGAYAQEVKSKYVREGRLAASCSTQRKIAARFRADDEHDRILSEGLMQLTEEVLFVEDPRKRGFYHPRIAAHATYAYRSLDDASRRSFDALYDEFFYRRHNACWRDSAMSKLPPLLASTEMMACGEDLGMIPDCVPEVMRRLGILSLEIQRMPKSAGELFADPSRYPYLSVCTTSTHDMNPLRAWWEEDRALTERFYRDVLGMEGDAPDVCTPQICRRILEQHLSSPAMLAVFPLQDWLATDPALRAPDPHGERINVPSNPRHYWRYRMPLSLEELLAQTDFNSRIRSMVERSGRA